MIRLTKP